MNQFPPARRAFNDPVLQSQFERDGYVVMDFLSEDEVRALRAWFTDNPDPVYGAFSFAATMLSGNVPYRLETTRRVGETFGMERRGLLDDYRFILGNFLMKKPHEGLVKVHQDPSFVYNDRYTAIEVWVPLVDVDPGNGCLRVVPGSHTLNTEPRPYFPIFPYRDLMQMIYADCLTDVPMSAGQAFVYTETLFHASMRNESDEIRLAVSGLYVPAEAELLWAHSDDMLNPTRLDLYEVSDDFYSTHVYGTRPAGTPAHVVDYTATPLSAEKLRATIGIGEPAPA
jgi:hypothetical protein